MSPRNRFWIAVATLTAMSVAFGSGWVLLLGFHIEQGCWRTEALGLSRLTWQNLHRFAALAGTATLGFHVASHFRGFWHRILRACAVKATARDRKELRFYALFATAMFTGLAAWLWVDASIPLTGPVKLGPLPHHRHHWIDVHNLAGLAAFALAIAHVKGRRKSLVNLAQRAKGHGMASCARSIRAISQTAWLGRRNP